ncbi:unnamed protein product [Moneuplotes crassus]|uniref:Uncharacterized protein n=1 Tax=Euplotes crassus TaxID=5936 RepID=A0AAD1Y302_EUPCR|nr:unnamed protein product [Moneuplotes crassus]
METEIQNSIQLITQGFEHHEEKIKHLLRGYSILNTPVINVIDIGNCFDSLEEILSIRLVPAAFIRGEIEVDKVLPFQQQQFYQSLESLASRYRGQKTLDINAFRDIIIDYLSIEGDEQANKKLGYYHRVDYVFTPTMKHNSSYNPITAELGATHPREGIELGEEDELQNMINQAEMEDDQEKLMLLRDLYTLNTELSISNNSQERVKIKRKIDMLKKRIYEPRERSPKQDIIRKKMDDAIANQEKQKEKEIKEIFKFYSRQHLMIGKKSTFENIQKQN